MARPHIMFIMAQDIPWTKGTYGTGRDDVESKVLSIDGAGTDATTIVRYPAGWSRIAPEHCSAHEEFLVLDGSITIDGKVYDRQCFGFFPAGYTRGRAESSRGAVVLSMFYDRPQWIAGKGSGFDEKLLVQHVDPKLMDWDPGLVDPQLAKGVAIKPLRTDPYTQEVSFLYFSPPHRVPAGMSKPQWTHPMVEELYTLEGEYVWADAGRMGPGGYCWWREDVFHGPSGTDTGYSLFVRTVNGPLVNTFDTVKKPFTWDPEFKPHLPDHLRKIAKPYIRAPFY